MQDKEEKTQLTVVIGAITDEEGRVLLQKRIDLMTPEAHEKWELPGGKIEFGEQVEEALCREVKEEIGCDVTLLRLLPSIQSKIWKDINGKNNHVLVLCFEAKLLNGIPKPLDKKVSEVGWYTKKDIENMDVLANVKHFVGML